MLGLPGEVSACLFADIAVQDLAELLDKDKDAR
jgi:hypothetical protein